MSELFWRGRRVIITGANGFLGRNVKWKLERMGANIFAPEHAAYDLRYPSDVEMMMSNGKADKETILFHLAARVGGIGANRAYPADFFYDNAMMNTLLVDVARACGIMRFVAIGSVCAYPKFCPVPFREENLWEGYPEETNAPYGLTKRNLLAQLQAYQSQYGLSSAFVVPTNLYGPGDNFDEHSSHVIPALIRRFYEATKSNTLNVTLWGSGNASRDFLYVEDAAEAIIIAAEKMDTPIPINLGSGDEVPIRMLAEIIAGLMNYRGEIWWDTTMPDGQPRRKLDTYRANHLLGWVSTTTLHSGLSYTVGSYEKACQYAS